MTLAYKSINKKRIPIWGRIRPLKSKDMLSAEKIYYYKGKTNQQLRQYSEALQCYNKALELNNDFEPAKKAKEEVEKIIKA